ncbi:Alpha/Beta hydrolase protein [Crucibulum laeve]|uniref:Alpha/Beta hydrolase protein n=1 Tax=Crucibulum laeve TaxID=68775 RepID=A0A5C3MG37_9AGAR|nr:Alpha/Beta hydrolase protein [Crucibulum laeve]
MAVPNEKYLRLPEDRILAYSENGNPSSSTFVIFFHGVFGVGNASDPNPILVQKDVHFVAPTLLGWGNSSIRKPSTPYFIQLAADITALIEHLHPDDPNLKLYIAGGSFGTVPAQMLYGASFDIFPPGRRLVGCMVLAPFSPFLWHTEYTKTMTTPNYIMVGPPSQYIPFRLLQHLAVIMMQGKLKTIEGAESFIRKTLFDNMDEEERLTFHTWAEERGKTTGQVQREMSENTVRSVRNTWGGFLEVSDVIHGDWGFRPDHLDEEHTKRPILVVASKGDTMAPDAMAKWLASTYKNVRYESVSGGHLGALYHLDRMWSILLEDMSNK